MDGEEKSGSGLVFFCVKEYPFIGVGGVGFY